jgi:hypothetical protein
MADEKKVTVNENTAKEEQIGTTPSGIPVEKIEKKHPIKDFFGRNKKKIGVGIGIAGAFAAGVVADKIGIKLPAGKKADEEDAAE